jgi:hypothetical protein
MPVRARTDRHGEVRVVALHPGGGTAMTRVQFCELLLGQVMATCKVIDRALLAKTQAA